MINIRNLSAFVLCGGLGTRLRSVVADSPKSMALVDGRPFLEILLERLASQGVRRFVLGTGYLAGQVEDYFGDGSKWGYEISYSQENDPMGTGGAIRLALPLLTDPCLVLNGDSFCDFALEDFTNLYEIKSANLVMGLRQVPDASRYGWVQVDGEGRLEAFHEKSSEARTGLINAGIYMLSRAVVQSIPPNEVVSFEKTIIPLWLKKNIWTFETKGKFIDIGIPEDYARAQILLSRSSW